MLLNKQVTVLDIQRMSTEDGPGLRTTLFLKGCSLHCDWCHNPESIDMKPVVQWNSSRCIDCNSCRGICPSGALIHETGWIRLDGNACKLCKSCVDECPSGALQVKGELWEREALLQELLKDRAYFGSEGGITLSGGEPLLQAEAALWLLQELKLKGFNTALDTAGLVPVEKLTSAMKYCDLLLYDLKLFNSALHRRHTGSGNEMIFANLLAAVEAAGRGGRKTEIWIRTPLIPGISATEENISGLAAWIMDNLSNAVSRWELCAYNNLCENKYQMLGLDWLYRHTALLKESELHFLTEVACDTLGSLGYRSVPGQEKRQNQDSEKGSKILVQWTGAAAPEAKKASGGDAGA